jgi:NADPH:quinone reductase-like Zn-dependent oxidoreductase
LRQGATLVAYGAQSGEPASVTNGALVYSNLTWKGFGIDRWLEGQRPGDRAEMLASLWASIRGGELPLPVAGRFALSQFVGALAAAALRVPGKVLLV